MYAYYTPKLNEKEPIVHLLECNSHSIISSIGKQACGSHHLVVLAIYVRSSFNTLMLIFDILSPIDEAIDLAQCYVRNKIHSFFSLHNTLIAISR